MNPLVTALKQVVNFLDAAKYKYMIVGGLANSIYGHPRQTFDINVKIILPEEGLNSFLEDLASFGDVLTENPHQFVAETGVIPVEVQGVRIDFIFAALDFEQEAIARSARKEIFGISAPVTSAEDLIIQKCISTRERDWLDIRGIIDNQRRGLDWDYLLKYVNDLADFLANPETIAKIKSYRNEVV